MSRSAGEICGIFTDSANITDSPDLGPPPVAHFEDGDPIKFDSNQEKRRAERIPGTMEEGQPVLSANLETRKKRRESSHHRDADDKKSSVKPSGEVIQKDLGSSTNQHLKSGAKRKLHVRDEEDQPHRSDDQAKDAFQFDRKASEAHSAEVNIAKPNPSRPNKSANERVPQTTVARTQLRKEKYTEAPAGSIATNRKVLGPS